MPQSQVTNCRRMSSFSEGFYTVVLEPHSYHQVAVLFEGWKFIYEPLESLLTHRPGSVRVLSVDRKMPLKIRRRLDDFYGNVYFKIVRWPDCVGPVTGPPPSRHLTESGQALPDYKSSSEHRLTTARSPGGIDFVNSIQTSLYYKSVC